MRHFPNLRAPVSLRIERTPVYKHQPSIRAIVILSCISGITVGAGFLWAFWPSN